MLGTQEALARDDVAGIVERFAAAAAAHPLHLSPAAADAKTLTGREALEVNAAARRAVAGEAAPAPAARDDLTTPEARQLRVGLHGVMSAADQKHADAQAMGVVYMGALIQGAANAFEGGAAMRAVAQDLHEGMLLLAAAENKTDTAAAQARIDAAFEKLDRAAPEATAGSAANEVRAVLREAAGDLAAAKTRALAVMDEITHAPDGTPLVHDGDFGYRFDESGRISSPALPDLQAFGGVMTPVRDACVPPLEALDEAVGALQDALPGTEDAAALRSLCGDLAGVEDLNPAAARTLEPQVQGLCDAAAKKEAAALFGLDLLALPPDASAADLAGRIDWTAVGNDPGRAARILDHVQGVLADVRPSGNPAEEADPALMRAARPLQTAREAALAAALESSPLVSDAAKARARALAAPTDAPAGERALALDRQLQALRDGLSEAVAAMDPKPAADALLARYGIDAQHPTGGMRGGLAGLAGA